MRRTVKLPMGLALATAFTLAASIAGAQVTATVVTKSGERHTGTNLGFRIDEREVAVRTSQNQEPRIPVSQVAYVDFGGSPDPSNLNLSGSQEAVVMRDGTVMKGQVIELGHTNRGDQTTPYLVVFRTEGGEEKRIPANQVARVYFSGGASSTSTTTSNPTSTAGTSGTADNRSLAVSGQQQWTNSNLVIRRGESLTFTASGEIQIRAGGSSNGPEGTGETNARNPLPTAPTGSLIGRIGNSQPFLIGNEETIQAPANGQLFLGVNDENVADNTGNFQVEVRRNSRSRR